MNIGAPRPDLEEAERRVHAMQSNLHQWATSDPGRQSRSQDHPHQRHEPAIMPLLADALSTKVLEYMAAARPVVVAVSGWTAEPVTSAGAGIVCSPEQPLALAEAIARLTSDPEQARLTGLRGHRYVEEQPDAPDSCRPARARARGAGPATATCQGAGPS